MGWDTPDVYYNPEAFGLEMVGDINLSEPSYDFDILAVLYNPERKNFYIVQDSGCSCPSPFEAHTTPDSLGQALTAHEAVKYVKDSVAERNTGGYSYGRGADDPSDLIAAIMRR